MRTPEQPGLFDEPKEEFPPLGQPLKGKREPKISEAQVDLGGQPSDEQGHINSVHRVTKPIPQDFRRHFAEMRKNKKK